VLDLGCGKGAAAISIAKHRGAGVHGIDGIDEFVRHASARASALGLSRRCRFDAGDVRDAVTTERGHDLVMMLALGELLGDTADTIGALRACVVPQGHLLIDGAYLEPSCDDDALRELYPTRAQAVGELQRFGDRLVHERVVDGSDQAAHYRAVTDRLAKRADEVCAQHPQAADAIREFVARQQQAADGLGGPVVGCLWLLQRA
jgi:trans-aconitate methyltransferase